MNQTNAFEKLLETTPCILGEGAVIERLRRNPKVSLDEHIVNAAFIYDADQREAQTDIYKQYLDIGRQYDLPVMLSTPTWRASRQRIADAGYADKDINRDNFIFFDRLRKDYGDYAKNVVIGGLMSCRGDAYSPDEAMSKKSAYEFHAWQANKLAHAGVDFLMAATLPALSEATGLARAMAETGRPYVVSFIARPEGTLLDGTPLKDALDAIDSEAFTQPLAYMINCTHASNFKAALHSANASSHVKDRIIGLLANTAALTPEELDNSQKTITEAPDIFGQTVADLHKSLKMKVLGGCCGTDHRHIEALAKRLRQRK